MAKVDDNLKAALNMGAEPEAEVAPPKKGAKELWQEGFSQRHADIDPNDEEAYYGAINQDYADWDSAAEQNKENSEANARVVEMLEENPAVAEIIYQMYNGQSPWQAMARLFGPDIVELMKDPENEELAQQIIEGQNDYTERVKKSKDLQSQAEKNIGPSLDALAEVIQERGMDESQQAAVVKLYNDIQEGALVDRISKETWSMLADAVLHDTDVDIASSEGEMRGRNRRNTIERRRLAQGANPTTMRGQGGTSGNTAQATEEVLPGISSKPWYERE